MKSDNKMKLLAIAICLVGVIVTEFCFWCGAGFEMSFLGIVLILLGGALFANYKRLSTLDKIENYVQFDEMTGTLHVKKRSASLKNLFSISEGADHIIAHKEKELHIGGATVGGITTGGAYTTGGYDYIAASKKNGSYYLNYLTHRIEHIQLNADLCKKAEQSAVSQYLNKETMLILTDTSLKSCKTILAWLTEEIS